ncbi:MAG: hypothetical protein IJM71_03705, partial [Clostridia bacterium]|nr:hypothetical protein [Clostridia bacterium]
MKKTTKILSALFALAFVFALFSCSGTNGSGQGGAGRQTSSVPANETGTETASIGTESETAAPSPSTVDGWASVTGSYAAGDLVYTRADGTAVYVKHDPRQLPYGTRWIARTVDEDALGMCLPATAEHKGRIYCREHRQQRILNKLTQERLA